MAEKEANALDEKITYADITIKPGKRGLYYDPCHGNKKNVPANSGRTGL
jgi:hypothetical protein